MTDTAPAIEALLAEHADLERQLADPADGRAVHKGVELGQIAWTARFERRSQLISADIDLERLIEASTA